MPSFDVILVSWNRLEYLKRTFGSLIQSGSVRDAQRVIVVDNGSTQEGVHEFLEQMRKEYGIYVVLRPHNNGWGQAVNDVLGMSRAEYIFLSNNDVDYSIDFHKKMFEVFEHQPNIGILGVWKHIHHGYVRGGVQNKWFVEKDNMPAVGWMMPKKVMEAVGMLPEHGPCFTKGGNGEDTGYVMKMKEKGFLVGGMQEDVGIHIDGY